MKLIIQRNNHSLSSKIGGYIYLIDKCFIFVIILDVCFILNKCLIFEIKQNL